MDPTVQSPVRMKVPIPFSDGIEVPVPSGPHFYSNKTWIGRVSDGVTQRQAFEALARHATPGQTATSVDGGTVEIPGLGTVRQRVDPDRLMVVNTTQPDHWLHPGNAHRSIAQIGDDLYVVTHGYGTGILPPLNQTLGSALWKSVDSDIRRELNPYIEAPASDSEMVRDSIAHSGIPGRRNVFEFGFPDAGSITPSTPLGATDDADSPKKSTSIPVPAPPQGWPGLLMDHIRRLNEKDANKQPASVFNAAAPAVLFVPDDGEESFADGFGDRPPIRRLSSRLDRR